MHEVPDRYVDAYRKSHIPGSIKHAQMIGWVDCKMLGVGSWIVWEWRPSDSPMLGVFNLPVRRKRALSFFLFLGREFCQRSVIVRCKNPSTNSVR